MNFLIYALPFIYAILNRFRGTGGVPVIKNGGPAAAILTGLIFGLITSNAILGLCVTGAYFVGEMFAWGKWISAMPHVFDKKWQTTYNVKLAKRDDGDNNGIHWIANTLIDEKKNFAGYSILALFLRGIWWWAPVYAVLVGFGAISAFVAIPAVLTLGAAFPLSFIISGRGKIETFWDNGEYIYGFIQGLVFIATFFQFL